MTGMELKRIRLYLKMTQTEFGEELGFPNPQIQVSQLEHDQRPITGRLEKSIEHWLESIRLKNQRGDKWTNK